MFAVIFKADNNIISQRGYFLVEILTFAQSPGTFWFILNEIFIEIRHNLASETIRTPALRAR